MCQITRSHYQNAVTATRMDNSPLTPDADARLTESSTLSPEPPTTAHAATLMPPQQTTTTLAPQARESSRPGSARARAQQSSVPQSTSTLNEKNRIVREYPQVWTVQTRMTERGNHQPQQTVSSETTVIVSHCCFPECNLHQGKSESSFSYILTEALKYSTVEIQRDVCSKTQIFSRLLAKPNSR